jgi:hypothetical protein
MTIATEIAAITAATNLTPTLSHEHDHTCALWTRRTISNEQRSTVTIDLWTEHRDGHDPPVYVHTVGDFSGHPGEFEEVAMAVVQVQQLADRILSVTPCDRHQVAAAIF